MRRFSMSTTTATWLATTMTLTALTGAVRADEAPPPNAKGAILGEVLVTASKRGETSVLDTPIAIQAITSEQLQAQGITQFADYARSISGLSFEDQGPGDKKIVLRGMQSTGAATTGLYFDDIVITANNRQDGGGRQPDIRLVDMERLEVLKGPQGTLYGAGSMSGTVRMITNKPDPGMMTGAFNSNLSTTRDAGDPNYDFDATLNIPVIQDKLALRVVGYRSELAGFIDDRLLGRESVNNQRVTGGRVALRWLIADDVTLDAMWVNQKTSAAGAAYYQPLFGEFVQRNNTGSEWDESLDAYNVALNWKLDSGTITASASRMDRDIFYRFPGARILCSIFGGAQENCFAPDDPLLTDNRASADQPQDRTVAVSELRYASDWNSPLQVIGGLFYEKEENNFRSRITDVNEEGERLVGREHFNSNRIVNNEITQYAAFGELSYSLTDALTATVGMRAFRFEVDEVGQNRASRTRPVDQAPVFTSSQDEDMTFKYNLQYKFDADRMVYANYAEGFRSGGNNEPDYLTGTVLPPYKSDTVESYELGAKGLFLNGALQLDAAAYYMDWQDLQARVSAQIEGSSFLMLGNVGAARIKGVEVGAQSAPFDSLDLTLGGNFTVLQAELTEDGPVGLAGRKGDRIPNVPEFTANVFADYAFDVAGSWETTARIDYSYVGDSFSDFNSTKPIYTRQGDYSLVNLRVAFERDRYKLSVFANNVLDEQAYVSSSIDVRRPLEVIPLRPRTIGIGFGYSF